MCYFMLLVTYYRLLWGIVTLHLQIKVWIYATYLTAQGSMSSTGSWACSVTFLYGALYRLLVVLKILFIVLRPFKRWYALGRMCHTNLVVEGHHSLTFLKITFLKHLKCVERKRPLKEHLLVETGHNIVWSQQLVLFTLLVFTHEILLASHVWLFSDVYEWSWQYGVIQCIQSRPQQFAWIIMRPDYWDLIK